MNRVFLFIPLVFLLNLKPFWDKTGEEVVLSLPASNAYICVTDNKYIFKKNSINFCKPMGNLEENLQEIATEQNRKSVRVVFADIDKQYLNAEIWIKEEKFKLIGLLYYSRSKTLYADLLQGKKYYFFRIGPGLNVKIMD